MKEPAARQMLELDWRSVTDEIIRFIREQHHALNTKGMVVGISGGLDSALTVFLGVQALGKKHVQGVFLPERDTSRRSFDDARLIAKSCGISLKEIDLTKSLEHLGCYRGAVAKFTRYSAVNQTAYWMLQHVFRRDPYRTTIEGTDNIILGKAIAAYRLKHRMRMAVLYQQAEQRGFSVAGCLNMTEYLTGLFVQYGDSVSDYAPILDLFKTQVIPLASHIGVPQEIINKVPTPDLLPGIVDETALGITYEKLDLILHALEEGLSLQEVSEKTGAETEAVNRINEFVKKSSRLREHIPYPQLRK